MVKPTPKGLTLIEILLGMGVTIALALVTTMLFRQFTAGVKRTSEQVDQKTRFLAFTGHLQRFMGTGDSQLMGFSGLPAPQPPLVRFLLPLPNRCADFSQPCPNDVSFLYVNYQKSTFPAVSAICPLGSDRLLIDLKRTTYGIAVARPTGFEVVAPAPGDARWPVGMVPVSENRLLGIVHPPQITMWRSTATPDKLDITVDATTGALDPPLPAECVARLQRTNGLPDVSELYEVPLQPFILTQFTGGTTVTAGQRVSAMGRFPLRVFSSSISSIGKVSPSTGEGSLVLRDCAVGSTGVACTGRDLFRIDEVERFKVGQFFKVSVGNPSQRHFSMVGAPGEGPAGCRPPGCLEMVVPPPGSILPQIAGETLLTLNPARFSFLKQKVLSRLRFYASVGQREETFDVAFP